MATGEILLRPACVANLEKYLGYVFSIHCTFLSLKFVALWYKGKVWVLFCKVASVGETIDGK